MEGGAELSEVELDSSAKDGDGEVGGCEEVVEASGEFRYEEHEFLGEDAEGLLRESHALLRKEKVQLRVGKHQPKINVLAELEILKQRRQKRQAGKNFAHRRELEVVASFVGQPKISWDADYKARLTQSSVGDENKATLTSQTEVFWSQGQAGSQSQVVAQSQVEQFHSSQREGGTQVSVPEAAVPETQLSSQYSPPNNETADRVTTKDQESDEEHLVVLPPQKLPDSIQERNHLRRELLGEAERKKLLLRRDQGGFNERSIEMNNDDASSAYDSDSQEVGAEQEKKPAADDLVESSSESEAGSVERTYGTRNLAKSGEVSAARSDAVEESPFIDNEADDENEEELPEGARDKDAAEESVASGESVLEQLIDDSVIDAEQLHDHRLLDKKREEEVGDGAVRKAGISSFSRQNRTRRNDASRSKENLTATHPPERCVLSSERDLNGSKSDLHESERDEAARRKRAKALWKAKMDRKSSFSQESLSQCAFADETSRSSVVYNLKARFATKRPEPKPKRSFISPRKMRRQAVSLNDWCISKPGIDKVKDHEEDPSSSKSVPFGFFSRPQSTSSTKTS